MTTWRAVVLHRESYKGLAPPRKTTKHRKPAINQTTVNWHNSQTKIAVVLSTGGGSVEDINVVVHVSMCMVRRSALKLGIQACFGTRSGDGAPEGSILISLTWLTR